MTYKDIEEVTEVAKNILKERKDIYSEHILAYISFLEKENAKLSRKLELASEFYARKNSISMFEYEKEKFNKEIEERYNFEMEDYEDN